MNTGAIVSTTLITKLHVEERPALFTAVQTTVLLPSENVTGVAGEHETDLMPEGSVAETVGTNDDTVNFGTPPVAL